MGNLLFAGLSNHSTEPAETIPSHTKKHSEFIVTLIAFLFSLGSSFGKVLRSVSPHLNAVFCQMDIVCIKMSAQPGRRHRCLTSKGWIDVILQPNQYHLRGENIAAASIMDPSKVYGRCRLFHLTANWSYESVISAAALMCGGRRGNMWPMLSNGAGKQNAGIATEPEAIGEKLPDGRSRIFLWEARRVSGKLFKLKLHF